MKLATFLLAPLAAFALAAAPQKPVIISYPDNTPDSVLDQAKDAIKEAGGMITHEYKLIKAFAANAPAKVLQTIKTLESQNNAVIEDDQVITVADS